jgi:hypothetical protein
MADPELEKRVFSTYNSLRIGMIAIAAATPFAIVLWGWKFGIASQDSISAYYFAPAADSSVFSIYPCRGLFTGILFAIGSFLYLYKGFSRLEDRALNCAGVCAVGVALCPMYAQPGYIPHSNYFHFTFAVLMFVCMAITAIFCHEQTVRWIDDKDRRRRYKNAYHVIGVFMVLFPVTGFALAHWLRESPAIVYWIEATGIWSFSAYWYVKSRELEGTESEAKALAAMRQSVKQADDSGKQSKAGGSQHDQPGDPSVESAQPLPLR